MRRLLLPLLAAAAFAAAFVAVRIPFYSAPLRGEEGIFAHLLLSRPPGPDYLLVGRIGGKDRYWPPEHPALQYELVRLAGGIFTRMVPAWGALAEDALVSGMRAAFSAFQLAVYLAIVLLVVAGAPREATRPRKALLLGLSLAVAISPLSVRSSVNLQLDGSVGALLTGALPVAVLAYRWGAISFRAFVPLAFLSSVLVGIGKNEWTLALWGALAIGAAHRLWSRSDPEARRDLLGLAAVAAGDVAGNLVSYLYDPFNHLRGFAVMGRITHAVGFGHTAGLDRLGTLLRLRWPFVFAPLLLVAFLVAALPRRELRGRFWEVWLAIFGAGLLGGFLLSGWNAEGRYYAPCLAALLCASIGALSGPGPGWRAPVAAAVCAAMAVPSLLAASDELAIAHSRSASPPAARLSRAAASGCVPLLEPSVAYRGSADFVSDSLADSEIAGLLAGHRLHACPR